MLLVTLSELSLASCLTLSTTPLTSVNPSRTSFKPALPEAEVCIRLQGVVVIIGRADYNCRRHQMSVLGDSYGLDDSYYMNTLLANLITVRLR